MSLQFAGSRPTIATASTIRKAEKKHSHDEVLVTVQHMAATSYCRVISPTIRIIRTSSVHPLALQVKGMNSFCRIRDLKQPWLHNVDCQCRPDGQKVHLSALLRPEDPWLECPFSRAPPRLGHDMPCSSLRRKSRQSWC